VENGQKENDYERNGNVETATWEDTGWINDTPTSVKVAPDVSLMSAGCPVCRSAIHTMVMRVFY